MRKQYNGYLIEISSYEQVDKWHAMVIVTPAGTGQQKSLAVGRAIIGGYNTQFEAESAALMWAKEKIDETD